MQPASIAPPPRIPPVERPSPPLYFSHFVGHMDNFAVVLETVARCRWTQCVDSDARCRRFFVTKAPIDRPVGEQADKDDQTA